MSRPTMAEIQEYTASLNGGRWVTAEPWPSEPREPIWGTGPYGAEIKRRGVEIGEWGIRLVAKIDGGMAETVIPWPVITDAQMGWRRLVCMTCERLPWPARLVGP